jgi:predicted nucleotidyltransferase component of viral defense system
MNGYNQLQIREIFHLEFLRHMGRKVKSDNYVLKGGTNLRFFFHSLRYSEVMDMDVIKIGVNALKEIVMNILQSPSFLDTLRSFGIERVVPPNISKAKQTETTQRFKIHLITAAAEEFFTKVEFSRRGFKGQVVRESVTDNIVRAYRIPPLIIPHYDAFSATAQKIDALATRNVIQARDIFDLYILQAQYKDLRPEEARAKNALAKEILSMNKLKKAHSNIFEISFLQFRDTVLSYLAEEDRLVYNSVSTWEEIKLKVALFIEELMEKNG